VPAGRQASHPDPLCVATNNSKQFNGTSLFKYPNSLCLEDIGIVTVPFNKEIDARQFGLIEQPHRMSIKWRLGRFTAILSDLKFLYSILSRIRVS